MANIQLSKNLRYKRKQYNLTQEDISAKLNISRQAYSNYETGKRIPDLDSLTYLCHIFNLSLDERQEFLRLYYILLQGEETYRNRQAVCELLNHLSSVEFHKIAPPVASKLPSVNSLIVIR